MPRVIKSKLFSSKQVFLIHFVIFYVLLIKAAGDYFGCLHTVILLLSAIGFGIHFRLSFNKNPCNCIPTIGDSQAYHLSSKAHLFSKKLRDHRSKDEKKFTNPLKLSTCTLFSSFLLKSGVASIVDRCSLIGFHILGLIGFRRFEDSE